MGETAMASFLGTERLSFSILERIDVGETQTGEVHGPRGEVLSVSSNGSTWVKPARIPRCGRGAGSFSILERIDVGETAPEPAPAPAHWAAFSILERIDVGETICHACQFPHTNTTFSILERIDVGETRASYLVCRSTCPFQYPRTDRRG